MRTHVGRERERERNDTHTHTHTIKIDGSGELGEESWPTIQTRVPLYRLRCFL